MNEKESKVCEECKLPIDDFVRYCSHCGSEQEVVESDDKHKPKKSSLVNFCVNCNESISEDAKYCSHCGFIQETPPSRDDAAVNSLDMELPKSRTGSSTDNLPGSSEKSDVTAVLSSKKPVPAKNKKKAVLLAVILGGLGFHKFYLGKYAMGILYLVFCWTFIPIVLSFVEGIIYLFKSDEKFQEEYS
ncbi:MAG: NINE protein [Candidatus Hodarchaeota archaeon]